MSSAAMCTIFFIVVTPHIQRCVDYYSLIKCWYHHTILGHIYDVTTFQTIVMSHLGSFVTSLCPLFLIQIGFCDNIYIN